MQKWFKVIIGIIVSFLILIVAAGFIFYHMLTTSLPKYSGRITVQGISGEIKIYRDSMSVPYIVANSDEDAAFALGYVHAEDRLFSMDLIRRAGEGKLSEIIGPKTIPFDKMFRTIGITETAKKIFAQLDPATLKILTAYSNGVNFYINHEKGKYPVEFDLLGYDPQPWKPIDCIVLGRMMAWELNISWWSDFAFIDLIQKFGYDKVKDIMPSFPENSPAIIPNDTKNILHVSNSFMKTDQAFRNFMGWTGTHIGSNNWIVNGNLSTTGKPIIANDTHLAFSAPGRWYAAVIRTPAETAAGFTLPGDPGIIIGENGNIAWALTNIMEDDADFYSEQIDSTGTKYFYNGAWQNLFVRKEIIKVRDSSSVVIEVKSTGHGPIISDIHPYNFIFTNKNIPDHKNAVISMHWLGNYVSYEIKAIDEIDKAKNWNEFKDALIDYSVPGQNFVYGDKDGNIGYFFGAKLPIRNLNTKEFIYDGTNEQNDWKGFVPQNELPQLFNPSQNYIASANNKTVQNFKYYISNLWEPSSRIDRITQLLNSKEKFSVNDFKKFQMDVTSPYAEKVTKYILDAFRDVKVTDSHLQLALKLLRNWDFKMDQYSQAPAIYSKFFEKLMENIFLNKMGEALYDEYVFVQNIPLRTIIQLLDNPQSSWFDDPSTPEIETRDDIIRKSMDNALTDLEKNYGEDPAEWQWGRLHHVIFKHPFSGVSSIVDKVLNIGPYEIGGDGTTIFNTEYSFTKGLDNYPQFKHGEFENNLGPVMRYIYDFSKPDEINLILCTGESGNFLSQHYKDMTNLWLTGKYIKVKTDLKSVENKKNKLLVLIPSE